MGLKVIVEEEETKPKVIPTIRALEYLFCTTLRATTGVIQRLIQHRLVVNLLGHFSQRELQQQHHHHHLPQQPQQEQLQQHNNHHIHHRGWQGQPPPKEMRNLDRPPFELQQQPDRFPPRPPHSQGPILHTFSQRTIRTDLMKIGPPRPPPGRAGWTISNITAGCYCREHFPVLIDILGKAEFKTRKEAAWAITNARSGGTAEQIRFLVNLGCIHPLCELLTVMDAKIIQVALSGLENILRLQQEAHTRSMPNAYAILIEECYGLEKIEIFAIA